MDSQHSPKAVALSAAARLPLPAPEGGAGEHDLQVARVRQSLLYVRRGTRPPSWSAIDVAAR